MRNLKHPSLQHYKIEAEPSDSCLGCRCQSGSRYEAVYNVCMLCVCVCVFGQKEKGNHGKPIIDKNMNHNLTMYILLYPSDSSLIPFYIHYLYSASLKFNIVYLFPLQVCLRVFSQ